jgi:CheY-like chemotaxis protein
VESREGHGAEFHIELPSAAHHHGNAPGPANRNGHDATILIIDDMPEITSMLQDGLSALGQNVLAALSGREGLSIIENVKVDCVVCDLGMMDMNGRQVSLAVKEFFETRKLRKPPFILLTGWASVTDDYSDLYNAGIDKVLAKPIDVVALLEEVRRALREQAGSETS